MSAEPSQPAGKRALIVDDSRSARIILSRMLEGYGLLVDTAESAEQGLEYLKQTRPDVIFMDHLMPGMDGFQAVQVIKSNPETATIPVVMYTSQEGELYLSQARALGAVGVLAKTVKQADVSKVLYQLRLLPDRREQRSASANEDAVSSVQVEIPNKAAPGELETAIRSAVAPLLQEHVSELRRFVLASLESFARRLSSEHEHASSRAPEPLPQQDESKRALRLWPLVAVMAVLALVPTAVLSVMNLRSHEQIRMLMQRNAELSAIVAQQQEQLSAQHSATPHASEPMQNASQDRPDIAHELVPYGEVPLAGTRLERLRALISDLQAQEFEGKIRVAIYSGEFCLTGNGHEGYSLAADDLPFKRCDVVGNPFDEAMTDAQRQSLAFANLLSSLRTDAARFVVEVQHLGRKPAVPYPDPNQDGLTAGDWNRAAAMNNRVEFVTEPRAR